MSPNRVDFVYINICYVNKGHVDINPVNITRRCKASGPLLNLMSNFQGDETAEQLRALVAFLVVMLLVMVAIALVVVVVVVVGFVEGFLC